MATTTSGSSHAKEERDNLLREPREDETFETIERVKTSYESPEHNNELKLDYSNRKYGQQYANIYFMRLEKLRNEAFKAGREAWNGKEFNGMKASYCGKVLDVKQGNLVWMVGTVYKEMKYKPNILDDVAASHYGAPPIRHDRYFDKDSDQILLEDESGRVQLFGSAVRDELLVTGIVVAVLGTETTDGGFDVADIKFPGYAPQMMRSKPENSHNGGRYVALVSGMLLGSEDEDVQKVELLQEYLCGELGGSEDQKESAAVGMLLIGGDSLAQQHVEARTMNNSGVPRFDSEPLHKFDSFIADVALSMPVSIMPGKADPTNLSMPQQPLNYSLLHQSRKLRESKSVSCVTNPSWWELDGTRVLGTSGQTIDDIHKYFDVEDRLEMMDRTLRWRHCAPTAPDTLWSYPFADRDPFILTESPHLYFVGNQDQFSTRLVESKDANGGPITTRLITVPRFKETGTIVLVNLETLDCKLVKV